MPQITVEQIVHQRALARLAVHPTTANRLKAQAARQQCIKHYKACSCKALEEVKACPPVKAKSSPPPIGEVMKLVKRGKKLFGL